MLYKHLISFLLTYKKIDSQELRSRIRMSHLNFLCFWLAWSNTILIYLKQDIFSGFLPSFPHRDPLFIWDSNQFYHQWWCALQLCRGWDSLVIWVNSQEYSWHLIRQNDFSCLLKPGLLPLYKKWNVVTPSPLSTISPVNLTEDFRFICSLCR